jgi:hypothetical protein
MTRGVAEPGGGGGVWLRRSAAAGCSAAPLHVMHKWNRFTVVEMTAILMAFKKKSKTVLTVTP